MNSQKALDFGILLVMHSVTKVFGGTLGMTVKEGLAVKEGLRTLGLMWHKEIEVEETSSKLWS